MSLATSAARLIGRHGRLILYRKVVRTYDRATGTTADVNTDYPMKAVWRSIDLALVNETSIFQGDVMVEIVPFAARPTEDDIMFDSVDASGSAYRIVNINELRDSTNTVLWKLHGRKA